MDRAKFLKWCGFSGLALLAVLLSPFFVMAYLHLSGCRGGDCGLLGLVIVILTRIAGAALFAAIAIVTLVRRIRFLGLSPIFAILAVLMVFGSIETITGGPIFSIVTRYTLVRRFIPAILLIGHFVALAMTPDQRSKAHPAALWGFVVASVYVVLRDLPAFTFPLTITPFWMPVMTGSYRVVRLVGWGLPGMWPLPLAAVIALACQVALVRGWRRALA